MNTTSYSQLLTDIQEYGKLQYKLLQVKGIEQLSRLIGVIITVVMITAIVVIALIFLAVALAAWLEQWLPMWASYLVIAGAMLLIAMIIYGGRILWFVRPIEKHLSEVMLDDTTLLKRQKQSIDSQSTMQRELLRRDMKNIQEEWKLLQRVLQLIRGMIS